MCISIHCHRDSNQRKGFTLIEVLAAMAVLMVLVLLLMRVFNASTDAMDKGINTAMGNSAARAALNLIRSDLEGLVVNQNFGMYKASNCLDEHYDRILFVTTTGDPANKDDERNITFVEYYVTNMIASGNKGYTPYRLMRRARNLADIGNDVLLPANREWWASGNILGDGELVVENVVSFDVFVVDEYNEDVWTLGGDPYFGGDGRFNSRLNSNSSSPGVIPSNIPPAAVEVYLQTASDETMQKAGLLLDAYNNGGGMAVRDRAYWMLTKESNVLITRAVPFAGLGQKVHPLTYYYP